MGDTVHIVTKKDDEYSDIQQIAMTYDGGLFYNQKKGRYYKMVLNGDYVDVTQEVMQVVNEKIMPYVDMLYAEIGPLFMELAKEVDESETLEGVMVQEQKDKAIRAEIKNKLAGALLYFARGGKL